MRIFTDIFASLFIYYQRSSKGMLTILAEMFIHLTTRNAFSHEDVTSQVRQNLQIGRSHWLNVETTDVRVRTKDNRVFSRRTH